MGTGSATQAAVTARSLWGDFGPAKTVTWSLVRRLALLVCRVSSGLEISNYFFGSIFLRAR